MISPTPITVKVSAADNVSGFVTLLVVSCADERNGGSRRSNRSNLILDESGSKEKRLRQIVKD
jgi:hypothetical protein